MTVERHGTAADVVRAHLAENLARLHEEDARVRAGETSAVHQMRVAARRLRTALRTCQPLFEESTAALGDELRRLGRELSGARDAQVLRERLRLLVSTQPPELVLGPVDVLIDDELSAAEQRGRERALEALGDSRHDRLLDDLDALVRDLPTTEQGAMPAGDVLPRLLRRDVRRLRRAVRAARQAEAGEARDAALHNARRKAKRLRYAAELAVPALGEPAEELASAAEEVQEALGEHQDTVMSRRFLRELGARMHLDGTNGFTVGRLHAIEEARAAVAAEDFEHAWAHVEDHKIRKRQAG
jgi:CHAD domain-containing protein